MKRNEDSLRDFWDNIKHINICITRVPKREERKGQGLFEEKVVQNILSYMKDINIISRSLINSKQDEFK